MADERGNSMNRYLGMQSPNEDRKSQDMNLRAEESNSKDVVAIKKLEKEEINKSKSGVAQLLNEIRVHWALA